MITARFHHRIRGAFNWQTALLIVLLLVAAAGAAWFFVLPKLQKDIDSSPHVGVVTQLKGDVNMIREDKVYVVNPGVRLNVKDIVITAKGATMQMEMVDGSILRLGENSRIVLSEYKLDSNKKVVGAMVNVLSGWIRFAVAKLQKNASYRFNTPVMMVGVRGTEGIIHANNKVGDLLLQEGRVRVERAYGTKDVITGRDVIGGQYINRQYGGAFEHASKPPQEFQKRIPKSLNRYERMLRKAHEYEKKYIDPRYIRPVQPDDVRDLMWRHPHMRYRFKRRFEHFDFRRAPGARGPGPRRRDDRIDWDRWIKDPYGKKGFDKGPSGKTSGKKDRRKGKTYKEFDWERYIDGPRGGKRRYDGRPSGGRGSGGGGKDFDWEGYTRGGSGGGRRGGDGGDWGGGGGREW